MNPTISASNSSMHTEPSTVIEPATESSIQMPNSTVERRNQFRPRLISNRSCDCVTDVFFAIIGAIGCVFLALLAAKDSSNPLEKGLLTIGAVACGAFVIRMIAYGIMIRRCPNSQRFWLN